MYIPKVLQLVSRFQLRTARSQVDGGRDVHGCLGGDLVLFHVQAGGFR